MKWNNTAERYGAAPRLLHWSMAVLVIAALLLIETAGYAPRRSALRLGMREWHQQLALIAFILLGLRLVVRLRNVAPPISVALPAWQARASTMLHWLFYALLVVQPLLGMIMVQYDGRRVSLLGAELPRFIAADKAVGHRIEDVHELLGNVMIAAIALHVAAALWHHFVRRDNTLRRML